MAGLLFPLAFFTMSETVYVPGVLNITEGFWRVLVEGLPPVIVQVHVKGPAPVADPLKDTPSGAHPEVGVARIEATGTCA